MARRYYVAVRILGIGYWVLGIGF